MRHSQGAGVVWRWRLAAIGTGMLAMVGLGLAADDPTTAIGTGTYPAAYAIRGARVIAAPGKVIEPGTVVVRRGAIEAVGPDKDVAVPYDAETIEGKGMVVYPGFLDLYTTVGQKAGVERSSTGRGRLVELAETPLASTPTDNRRGLTPEFEVSGVLELDEKLAEPRRRLGFTDFVSAPAGAIVTGQSALASLSGLPRRDAIVAAPVALHINPAPPFEPAGPSTKNETPGFPGQGRRRMFNPPEGPVENPYPRVLMGSIAHLRQGMLDANHQKEREAFAEKHGGPRPPFDPSLQALASARSKKLPVWWEANTEDEIHRALDLAEEFGTSAVIVGGREAGKVVDRLKAYHVPVVLRLTVPEEPKVPPDSDYRQQKAAERKAPLRVLKERHDKWRDQLATAAKLAEAGLPFAFATDGVDRLDTVPANLRKFIEAGLKPDVALAALTTQAAAIAGVSGRLGSIEPGKLGHLVVMSAPFTDEKAKVRFVLVDGLKFEIKPEESSQTKAKGARGRSKGDDSAKKPEPKKDEKKAEPQKKAEEKPFTDAPSELDSDRKPTLHTGGNVFIKDATILTVTRGTIPKGSILVRDGKIQAVGKDIKPPEGVKVIEAAGLVAMPGIIDTHSHIAIQGGVNEGSLSVVPEVRVKDVVTGDDVAIYRAIAGGTTTARLLHGSANTIGGQDAVAKLKYGRPGRDLIIRHGPQGVKFALGENVTRSPRRFPNTRMGVQAVIEKSFEEARAYRAMWNAFKSSQKQANGRPMPPPRVDLRLEALADILDGKIRIHSHCYRSDEILMLLRTAQKYGVRVQSLQHVLEGYKVAAEIAAHGASASTFSDWWAYKVEAYDAIPFNAALLTEAGANVCIKSDDAELMRHLNLEAAKMVKYGGVSEDQALAMITLNPARELGLDDRIGSIEVGKDGDLAIFDAHPLDAFARCELAIIDGEVYFQRKEPGGRPSGKPGDHAKMPVADAALRGRSIEIAAQPKGVFALIGAHVHPVAGPEIERGTVVIANGKVAAVGKDGSVRIPPEAQTIDLGGLDLWPGLVDGGSTVGLTEISSLSETHDYADSARFQPELRTSTALHPDSEHIPVTRANGVLTAYVEPTGGLISGQGCVVNLDGWVPREMVISEGTALNVSIPAFVSRDGERRRFTPPGQGPGAGGEPDDPNAKRKEQLDSIKEVFRKAIAHDRVVRAARERGAMPPAPDPRLEALAPFARGEKPVIFHADQEVEILDALDLARELKLKAILSGAGEAWKVVDALKAAKVPVLLGGTLRLPRKDFDPYDAVYATPAKLNAAGITFAIRSQYGPDGPGEATAARNLPYEAGVAVAFGLPEADALKAITIEPARILGIADQVGSIEPGKRANLVVTAGDILQPTTSVVSLFIDGKPVRPESKHTRLYQKYRHRLDEVRSGRARMGIDPVSSSEVGRRQAKPATVGRSGS